MKSLILWITILFPSKIMVLEGTLGNLHVQGVVLARHQGLREGHPGGSIFLGSGGVTVRRCQGERAVRVMGGLRTRPDMLSSS